MAREKTGSEGEAYRYVKKFLINYDREHPGFIDGFGAHVRDYSAKYTVSLLRAFFMELRHLFFRNGVGDVYFAPGVARLAVDLCFHQDNPDFRSLDNLVYIVNMISTAHRAEYDRNLNGVSYKDLDSTYGTVVNQNWQEIKTLLKTMDYGPRRYEIIKLDSFETANKYMSYTEPNTWCHFKYKDMFQSYSHNGYIDLYLAVLPGYETMTMDDPLYGESMLGIDIGYEGRLIHVNNRWNHAKDSVDGRKGDNKYNEIELSELLGGPFYEICPGTLSFDKDKLIQEIYERIHAKTQKYIDLANEMRDIVSSASGCRIVAAPYRHRDEWFYDERDGSHYRTVEIGDSTWMLEPLHYIPKDKIFGECDRYITMVCTPDYPNNPTADVTAGEMGIRGYSHTTNNYIVTSGLGYLSNSNGPIETFSSSYKYGFKNGTFPQCPDIIRREINEGIYPEYTVLYRGKLDEYIPKGWRLPTVEEYTRLFAVCAGTTVRIDDMTDKILAEEPSQVEHRFQEVTGLRRNGFYIHGSTEDLWYMHLDQFTAKRNWANMGGNPIMFHDDGIVQVNVCETASNGEIVGGTNVAYNLCDGFFYSSDELAEKCQHVRVGPYGVQLSLGNPISMFITTSGQSKYAPLFLVKKKPTDNELTVKHSWRC